MPFTLKVQELSIGYSTTLLENLSFQIDSSHTVFVIGSNGKGKSCLGKTLLGLIPPRSGHLSRLNKDISIGYMTQGKLHSEHLPLTTRDFLALFDQESSWKDLLINRLNLNDLLDTSINILSYGQWQRVNLAQALLAKPKFLVVDEPAQGLDIFWQEKIYDVITQYAQIFGALCFCISHDTLAIHKNADYILCLDHLSFTKNEKNKQENKNQAFTLLDHQHSHHKDS